MNSDIVISDMRLPLVIEDITATWLTEALRFRYPGLAVTSLKIEEVNSTTSTKIWVRVSYGGRDYGLPTTMIVKGGFADHSPRLKRMYEVEALFYRNVRSFITVNAPHCYYAGTDPNSHQSIVVLEDLRPKHVTFRNVRQPTTYDQAARTLDAVAHLHAQTWNSPEFKRGGRFDWIVPRLDGYSVEYWRHYLKPEVWQSYIDGPRGAIVSTTLHSFDWVRGVMQQLSEYHSGFPPCLIHGDLHVGNTYFDADGTPGFVDFQAARGPWQHDFTIYVVGALDIVDRRRWEHSLLTYYLERLKFYGVDAPTYDEAWDAYRHEIGYGFIEWIVNENAFQPEAYNLAYDARFGVAALDHDIRSVFNGK